MLETSILATQQQKSAADQVDAATQQIREAADQLATEQAQWATTSERLEKLVDEIEAALRAGQQAGAGQAGEAAGAAGWAGPGGDRPVSGNGHVTVTAAAGAVGPAAPSGGPVSSYVQFRVAGEAYAVPAGRVVEGGAARLADPGAGHPAGTGWRPQHARHESCRSSTWPGCSASAAPHRRAGCWWPRPEMSRPVFEIDEVDAVRVLAGPDAEAESPLLLGVRLDGGQLIGYLDIPRVFDELRRSV